MPSTTVPAEKTDTARIRSQEAASPAGESRLLRRLLLILLAGLLIGLSAPPLLDHRWQSPERDALSRFRQTYFACTAAGAARLLPAPAENARNLLAHLSAEWEFQDERFLPLRDYRQTQTLLAQTQAALARLEIDLAAAQAREAQSVQRLVKELESNLDDLRAAFAQGAHEREIRQQYASAQIRFWEAEAFLRIPDFPKAASRATDGLKLTESALSGCRKLLSRFSRPEDLSLWRRRIDDAVTASRKGRLSLVVIKSRRRLDVYQDGRKTRSFPVDLGGRPIPRKAKEGDLATPEGAYKVAEKLGKGRTIYTLALRLDYPNAEDRARFDALKRQGAVPRNARIGGLIEIHGKGGRGFDWTLGCVALKDADMTWLFSRVAKGCPVFIVGSDGALPPDSPSAPPGAVAPERK